MKSKLHSVLVIDDDEPTNFFSRMILEQAECTEDIKTVQSGQEALDYLMNCKQASGRNGGPSYPELIFLDINMPAMNGWEFLEKYNQIEKQESARPVIVMLTTSQYPDDLTKAKSMDSIAEFENKPLTIEKLNTIVQKYFRTATPMT